MQPCRREEGEDPATESRVDENTCAIVEDDQIITVLGKNANMIVDGKDMVTTNVAEVTGSRPTAVSGLRIHALTEGCSFDVNTRKAAIPRIKLE